MSVLYKRGNADIQGNLTPMIDMTFLLIVFFVLVSRIVDVESVDMQLPEPQGAVATPMSEDQRLIVNVIPVGGGGLIEGYRAGGRDFPPGPAGVEALTGFLSSVYRGNPLININVRADRRTHYEYVEPAMSAIAQAARATPGVPAARVNLVVVDEE